MKVILGLGIIAGVYLYRDWLISVGKAGIVWIGHAAANAGSTAQTVPEPLESFQKLVEAFRNGEA